MRDYQLKNGDSKFPPFSEFVRFVTEIAEVQCLPVLSSLATNECEKNPNLESTRVGQDLEGMVKSVHLQQELRRNKQFQRMKRKYTVTGVVEHHMVLTCAKNL